MEFETVCVCGSPCSEDLSGSVSVPIYQNATFAHMAVGQSTGYDYSRLSNPTRESLQASMALLEGGEHCLAFSSGMAALALCMELFKPGDHLIITDDLYGGSRRLFDHVSKKNGLQFSIVNTSDLQAVELLFKENTRAVFIETPSNPMMQVSDIAALADLAHQRNALLLVDNTFLTPYFQKPLSLGADIVLHSATKYLGGHNDLLAGLLIVKEEDLNEKLQFLYKTTGACLAPFDSWLLIRSLKTLALRMRAIEENALKIAAYLRRHPAVRALHYIGLPEHPNYALSCRQSSGFGGMISFALESEELAVTALSRIRVIRYAESLGGVESLMTYPMMQTHADMPEEERRLKGIDECLLRLSVGVENADDLIADLEQAFFAL